VVLGEVWIEKAGGVNACAKKTACERDPLLELQRLHEATMLSKLIGSPPLTIGTI
jgi:hypothetical protein